MQESKKQSRKDLILLAAREVFLDKGFSGASIGEIVSKADVTHSLLFHHFKTKENLWKIVKNQIVSEGSKIVDNIPSLNQPLESFLFKLIRYAASFYEKNPDVVRMLNWQRLELEEDKDVGVASEDRWVTAANHFKNTGEINSTIPLEYVVSLTLAIVNGITLDQNSLLKTQKQKDEYIQFAVKSLMMSFSIDFANEAKK